MNTFLPYRDFDESARCLDYRRLGKQRVECKQILNVLINGADAWAHHPAVLMWKGYEATLCLYMEAMVKEWVDRGYKNTLIVPFYEAESISRYRDPWWLGKPKFHKSHKSNLLRKQPEHYKQFGWKVATNLDYWWPVTKNDPK